MTEAELHDEITGLADQLGITWHHCADSRCCAGQPGLPDLLLIGDRGLMFAETKSDTGRRSRAQLVYASRLHWACARYQLWTPEHWARGEIRAKLREIA
jgi:hypothetical protein